MKHSIFITLKTDKDSREIWKRICHLGINLTDTGAFVYIYGDCTEEETTLVESICREYGEICE